MKSPLAQFRGVLLAAALGLLAVDGSFAQGSSGAKEEWGSLMQEADKSISAKDYGRATKLLERALGVAQRTKGAEHPDVAETLSEFARIDYVQGRYAEAAVLYERALAISEKARGAEHSDVATILFNLGATRRHQQRFAEAEAFYERALSIREQALGKDHADLAGALRSLAQVYSAQGRYSEAEALYRRAFDIYYKAAGGVPTLAIAGVMNDLAEDLLAQGQYSRADSLLTDSLTIRKTILGDSHPSVAASLNNLATLAMMEGRYADAETRLKIALAITEKAFGPQHPTVAEGLGRLAVIYAEQGRFAEAEPLYKRSMAITEKVFGPEHPDLGRSINNLAVLYEAMGRIAEAETLHRRALALTEKAHGADHPSVASSLGNLAVILVQQGRYAEAEPLLKRALAIDVKVLGPDHPAVATTINSLAELYAAQGRLAEAEPLQEAVLRINKAAFGPDHPILAKSYGNLAVQRAAQGRLGEAESLHKLALAGKEKSLGKSHPAVATELNNLAALHVTQDRLDEATAESRRAYEILRQRFERGSTRADQLAEQRSRFRDFTFFIRLLSRGEGTAAESFEAAQLAQATSVGQTVARMAARFAGQGDELARAIRQHQDAADAYARADKALLDAISQPPRKDTAEHVAALRHDLDRLESTLAEQKRDLTARFPKYDSLVSPAPVTIGDAQKLLHSDEALLFYLIATGDNAFAWIVRPGRAEFIKLGITGEELGQRVAMLRERLDPEQNPGGLPFDETASQALHAQIFAPLESALAGARHVIVVSGGSLASLPLSVLVSRPATAGQKTEWTADRYAFSVVPSVSALRALRTFPRGTSAAEPFIGFGDPVLGGKAGDQRRLAMRAVFANVGGPARPGVADVDVIRNAAPLPETADELKAIAAILQAPASTLHLRSEANETQTKRMDLARYKVLAFATHGVMAGELSGIAEPGLILTPPAKGTELDDGYLSASEVAQLKLNADWVLLSACNTSAPDGAPGAEGLSGLAKGFFHAGARSLLVSNWYVVSDAAVKITTEMLRRIQADPQTGKAEALRQSMAQLRARPEYGHPLFWAPFMVVGEGGGH